MKKPNLPKPEPMELSKLAAILCPGAKTGAAMKRAMERAMEFYVEASLFVSELPDDSDSLMRYASDERWRDRFIKPLLQSAKKRKSKKLRYAQEPDAVFSPMDEKWKKTLELRVGAVTDEAREFLLQQGCDWNDITIIRKIRESVKDPDEFLAASKRVEDGKTVYDISVFLLDIVARKTKARRRESKREHARKKARKKLR